MIQQKPSSAAPTALIYITLGALLSVWSGIWFIYERNTENASRGVYYICSGLLLTGLALLAIGFAIGRVAHRAQSAEIAQDEAKVDAISRDPKVAQRI